MSTHNMFSSKIKKTIDIFWLKKVPYQELWSHIKEYEIKLKENKTLYIDVLTSNLHCACG